MPGLVVILCDSLPDLPCGGANYGIEVCIVIRFAAENFNAKSSLFEVCRVALQTLFYDVAEQIGVPLAVAEQGIRKDALELLMDGLGFTLRPAVAQSRVFRPS